MKFEMRSLKCEKFEDELGSRLLLQTSRFFRKLGV